VFKRLSVKCEQKAEAKRNGAQKDFKDSQKWQKTRDGQNEIMHGIVAKDKTPAKKKSTKPTLDDDDDDDSDSDGDEDDDEGGEGEGAGADDDVSAAAAAAAAKREAFARKRSKKGKKGAKDASSPGGAALAMAAGDDSPKRGPKKATKWSDSKLSSKERDELDYSQGKDEFSMTAEQRSKRDEHMKKLYGERTDEIDLDNLGDFSSDDDDDEEALTKAVKLGTASRMWSAFTGLVGGKVLDATDLEPVLQGVRESLIDKNVAVDVADKLVEALAKSLIGTKMESLTGVRRTVTEELERALTRILTPKQSVDIVREIRHVREKQRRPYVVVFCGVNGVGKSTSLAKVCNFLLGNDLKVSIAACDTFRAGAVEQLRVHARALGVDVYQRGYNKDPATIAAEAVKEAGRTGIDVVLVDTAGRMQDNTPLMVALAKLVAMNKPDLTLFVGEALVGNDGVDQLRGFNQALADHCVNEYGVTGARKQFIDGIMLTKFDTIDDKVGASLSMVYETGQPIIFVGVGQTYKDIRRMNVASLVRTLCK